MKPITSKNIGKIRRFLMMPFNCKWNAWIRDITAKYEKKENKCCGHFLHNNPDVYCPDCNPLNLKPIVGDGEMRQ